MGDPEMLGAEEEVVQAVEDSKYSNWEKFKAENESLVDSEIQILLEAHHRNLESLDQIYGFKPGGVKINPELVVQFSRDQWSFCGLLSDLAEAGGFENGDIERYLIGADHGFRFFVNNDGESYKFDYNESPETK